MATSEAATKDAPAAKAAELKDLYEVGEIPPLGHVPKNMYAWAIRRERHGNPEDAMQVEVVPTPEIDSHEVLVLVMAAGVNYNGVWAGLGTPVSPLIFTSRIITSPDRTLQALSMRSVPKSPAGKSATKWWFTVIRTMVKTKNAMVATLCSHQASAFGAMKHLMAPLPNSPTYRRSN